MSEPLKVSCAGGSEDHLYLSDATINGQGSALQLTVYENNKDALIYLDESRARQLFNWLGVWLHTR
jgi:hypothetical protein